MANESSRSDNTRSLACELLASLEVDRGQGTEVVVDSGIEKTFSGALLRGSRLNGEVIHGVVKLKLGLERNVVETHARLTVRTDDGATVSLDDRAEWRGKEDALARFLARNFLGVAEAYLIGIVTFEVADKRYLWLKSANVLSHGTLHGKKVRIEFFQLTGLADATSSNRNQLLRALKKENPAS
jgi:Protein of unknown function (DUF3237)